jgi:hypothetical protein
MKNFTITIKVDPTKVKRGHQPHRGGSGSMGDRRLKRLNTRGSQRRAVMAEY